MMERIARWRSMALALVLAGGIFAPLPPAAAEKPSPIDEEHDHDRVERAREKGEIRPLEEIMPMVRERFPGEIVRIEIERHHETWIYEFKVIDRTGRLLEVKVDAKTSRVVKVEGE